MKYILKKPFDWDGKKIESVDIEEPRGAHIKHMSEKSTMSDLIKIAVHCSGYTPAFYDKMAACDVIGVTEVIGDFLASGRETGAN